MIDFIEPGCPYQNAYIERFNRPYREEVLNMHFFSTLEQVQLQGITAELKVISDLRPAVENADIVSTATSAREAIIEGQWMQSCTHIDLIGSYTPDIRETDNILMAKGSIFVDYRDTTIQCVGDLTRPIANGTITAADIRGDLYDLVNGSAQGRRNSSDITIFKNGGAAHLDLMIADYVTRVVS